MIHPAFIPILLSLLILLMIRLYERHIYYWLLLCRGWIHNKLVERYGVIQLRYVQVRAEPVDLRAEVKVEERQLLEHLPSAREQLIRQIGAVAYPYVDIEIYRPHGEHYGFEPLYIRATWKQNEPFFKNDNSVYDPIIKNMQQAFKYDQQENK